MSGWEGGSTRAWRELRRMVLDRDRYRCQAPVTEDHPETGHRLTDRRTAPSTERATVGHVVRKDQGGTDAPTNLRAECAAYNYRDGQAYAQAKAATSVAAQPVSRW